MTHFDKPLLLVAAANFFVAFVAVSAGAETVTAPDARLVRLEAQIAAVQNGIRIAQGYGRPPGEIGEPGDVPYAGEQQDATQQGSAGLVVRIGRLESQMRQISGQIEQMQFETSRLAEQLKKFQEDVDFRFHEGGPQGAPTAKPAQKRGDASETQINGYGRDSPQSVAAAPSSGANRRGDAFDPSQNPGAPGEPRPLGGLSLGASTNSVGGRPNESAPADLGRNEPGAPLDLSNGHSPMAGPPPATPTPPMAPAAVRTSGITTPAGTVSAAAPNPAKEEFEIALSYFKQREYENAEKGFAGFLEKIPKTNWLPTPSIISAKASTSGAGTPRRRNNI